MTFESMANPAQQEIYNEAIEELASQANMASYNKAMNALINLYPQWNDYERSECIQQDLRDFLERNTNV